MFGTGWPLAIVSGTVVPPPGGRVSQTKPTVKALSAGAARVLTLNATPFAMIARPPPGPPEPPGAPEPVAPDAPGEPPPPASLPAADLGGNQPLLIRTAATTMNAKNDTN